MSDGEVPDSPFLSSPEHSFHAENREGCWPCGDSYDVDSNRRSRRKKLIIGLCLLLVAVVVVAIIILAVSRDSVRPSDSELEAAHIARNEEIRRGNRKTTTARTASSTRVTISTTEEAFPSGNDDSWADDEFFSDVKAFDDTTLSPSTDSNFVDMVANIVNNEKLWRDNRIPIDNSTKSRFQSAAVVFFTFPGQRMLDDPRDDTERYKKAVDQLVAEVAERRAEKPQAASWRSLDFDSTVYGKPLFQPSEDSSVEEKKLVSQRIQIILEMLGQPDDIDNVDSKYHEDFVLLSGVQDKLAPEGSDMSLNSSMVELVGNILERHLEERRNFGFDQVYDAISSKTPVELARTLNEAASDSAVKRMKIDALNKTLAKWADYEEFQGRTFLDGETPVMSKCPNKTQILCADGRGCYFESERCDRWIQCPDNSDEAGCSCLDYLKFEPEKRCDGYPDCLLGEDEEGCFCGKGMFLCARDGRSPICIPEKHRCDNVRDCENGADERNCFALSSTVMDPLAYGSLETSGYLHALVDNKWRLLSVEFPDDSDLVDFMEPLSADVCAELLTRPSGDPVPEYEDAKDFPELAHLPIEKNATSDLPTLRLGGRFKFIIDKPHDGCNVVKFDCGLPRCGVRTRLPNMPMIGSVKEIQEETTTPRPEKGSIDVRIVGGTSSQPYTWPFVVALLRDGKFVCGGTIIAKQWIVTAGHCLQDYDTKKYFFQVQVGTLRRSSISPFQYVRNIEEIFIHEQYNRTWLYNDIALAKVDKPFHFSPSTSFICLPDEDLFSRVDERVVPDVGDRCFAVGWGNTEELGTTSDTLMEVEIPILDSCTKSYNNKTYQICAGYKQGGKDSCQGDSGGPFFCEHLSRPGNWYLGGVISHGIGCARPENAGVYTRVQYYLPWIKSILSSDRTRLTPAPAYNQANLNCSTLTCDGGKCIASSNICNFFVDCIDGTDELYCKYNVDGNRVVARPMYTTESTTRATSLTTTTRETKIFTAKTVTECSPGMFRCTTTWQCIPKSSVCDRKKDCLDGTDERYCTNRDYLEREMPGRICDGYPDCQDWSDEVGCAFCPVESLFFCDLSKKCISRDNVCNKQAECHLREDERYCVTLVNGDSITLKRDSRPKNPDSGIVAMNVGGVWKPVCVEKWDDSANDMACRYMGKRAAVSYRLLNQQDVPLLVDGFPIQVQTDTDKYIYPRSALFEELENDVASSRNGSIHSLWKRSTTDCKFVDVTCTHNPACGTFPLYNFLGKETPTFGHGVFPWQVNIYKNGKYLCGASLIHNSWLITHRKCAELCDFSKEYCVARMGGYRDQSFMSPHDQFRRIVLLIQIPGEVQDIFLGTFDRPFELTDFVNTLCIPSQPWAPRGTKCFMTGKGEMVLHHSVETTYINECDITGNTYNICTEQSNPGVGCMERWSGALACPDGTGKYFAVGIYFSEAGGCNYNDPIPTKFITLTTNAIRDNINQVVRTAEDGPNPYVGLFDKDCDPAKGYHRCPLGECLDPARLCDGVPDCIDFSDENSTFCRVQARPCKHYNATHCECFANEMRCGNNMCVGRFRFCDGQDDCGDGSDEPMNCHQDCSLMLENFEEHKICDSKIDCVGDYDLGFDESAARCCPTFDVESRSGNFRCVNGVHDVANNSLVSFSDQCISQEFVCDYNLNFPSCRNGADEQDCFRLWNLSSEIPLDPYGRMISQAQGYLYFISHGQKHLYCANLDVFTEDRLQEIGRILCLKAHYPGFISIKLTATDSRQRLGGSSLALSPQDIYAFKECKIVHLVCSRRTYQVAY